MCGLWAYFLRPDFTDYATTTEFDLLCRQAEKSISSRGPDGCSQVSGLGKMMIFHRLAIHDMSALGDQPFNFEYYYPETNQRITLQLMCNGEIYNYDELVIRYQLQDKLRSRSDCEIICHLMKLNQFQLDKVLPLLDGEFAIVCSVNTSAPTSITGFIDEKDTDHDAVQNRVMWVARDPYGVRPLYWADMGPGIVFSSTLGGVMVDTM